MRELFLDLGIELTERQLNQFERYYELLVEWNEKINLTAITEKSEVYLKHFYDSLCVVKTHNFKDEKICDIGSGAGFPGIPLKIIYPEIDLTIIDSLNKRIKFLDLLCSELGIEANCVHARAEEYVLDKRETYDIAFARAVAKLNVLSELCIPYVKKNGYFIALKGANVSEEVNESKPAFKKLGSTLESVVEYQLPDSSGERGLVKIKKISSTNKKYPRIFGKIKKNPL
ncbi:16S rRNA (guanine(527)-N(7))-methyltransferase RsmG [Mycoplasmatota bacterium WC44]